MMAKAQIIDFHAYLGSDPYGDFSQGVDDLIAAMDRSGVAKAVVAPLIDHPGPGGDVLASLLRAHAQFPDRLIPFARLDPRYGDRALEALAYAIDDLGCAGLLFNPASTNSLPYHRRVLPLIRAAEARGIPLLIPAGNTYFGLPEQIAWLAEEVPDMPVIIGHMGTAFHATRAIAIAAEHPNVYLETSLQQSTRRLALAVETIGPHRVLFGSAAPYGALAVELLKVREAGLSEEALASVLGGNARRLLRFEDGP